MFDAFPVCSVVVTLWIVLCAFLVIKALVLMLSRTQLWSALAESGGRR